MKHVKTATGLVVLLAVVLAAGLSQAATLTVPGDHATIQAAIDAATDGDIIVVAPGTYVENLDVTARVQIVGAGSGDDPLANTIITQTAAGAGDAKVGVVQLVASGIPGDPILLQNLRLEPQGMAGISVGRFTEATNQTVEYVTLDNVHVVGTNINPSTEQERGLYVDLTSTLRYLTVTDCAFDNLTYGWYFQKEVSADASTVEHVDVTGTTFNHNNHKGLYAEKLSDAQFEGCTADDNGFDSSALPSYFAPWSCGIDVNLKAGTYAGLTFLDCVITGNATDESREGAGLTVKARGTGNDASYATFPATIDDVVIDGCYVVGNERGLRFGEPGKDNTTPTNVVVTGCVLVSNTQHYSGSDGSAYGDLINACTAAILAEDNYWGDSDPSDQIGLVGSAGAVDADPVLTANPLPQTLNVPGDYATIQAAVDAAVPGDLVAVAAGTYNERPYITKPITIAGADQATVIVDAAAAASGSYGFEIYADNVTVTDLTLVGDTGLSTPRYGFKVSNVSNLTLTDVTAREFYRTGLDLLGVDGGSLTRCSGLANGGHGLSVLDCNDVTITDLTVSGNGWQGVSVATWGRYSPLGTSGIVFAGANSLIDPFQIEMGDYNNPGVPPAGDAVITYSTNIADGADLTVQSGELAYAVHGEQDDAPDQVRIWLAPDLATAAALPAVGGPVGHFTGAGMFIESLVADGLLLITTGCSIQAAADFASDGDTIDLATGTFEEQVHITTDNLTLAGAGEGSTTILSPTDLVDYYTTSADNYPIVFIDGCTGVTVRDLTVDGGGRGDANYRFQGVGFWNAGGTLQDASVINVMDTPFSGAQHGVGVYAYNDTGGPYTVNLVRVTVDDYQKGGIALNGDGLTANVTDCVTIGQGPTDVTAQNGIQFFGSVGGTISGCQVTGNIYTGGSWAASGILLIDAGTVTMTGNTVNEGSPAVYCQETSADVTGLQINNSLTESGNGFYVRIQNALAGGKADGSVIEELQPSPFGDGVTDGKDSRGTASVSIADSRFVGQTTGYGLSASNYQAADVIDIDMTTTEIRNWGWGIVAFGSGGEVQIEAVGNGFIDNGGYFYASGDLTSQQNASGNFWTYTEPADLAAVVSGDIDYTPWAGGGSALAPGYAVDYSELWVDDDSPQSGADGRLLEALGLVSGSTIHVAGGDYTGTGQLVVNGDLHVLGDPADPAVLRPGFNTGSSGDARGWWLVSDPSTLELRDLVLDASGYDVYQGLRVTGGLDAADCAFRNLLYPGYGGVAIAAFGSLPMSLTDCTFENIGRVGALVWNPATVTGCTYTGKGAGDHLDYFLDIGGGGQAVVTGCTVTGNLGVASSDGSTSAAILVTTLYGDGSALTATGNVLTGNTAGISIGYDENDTSVVVANDNNLADNEWGMENTGSTVADGRNNWWGDASGPEHPANPLGLGSKVGDNILFDPYRTGVIVCSPDPLDLTQAQPTGDMVVSYLGGTGPIYGFSITVTWDQSVATATVSQPDNGPFAGTQMWQVLPVANGFTVDGAIGGDNPGIDMGELFKLNFTGVGGEGAEADVNLTVNYAQDYGQPPYDPAPTADTGLVRVDLGLPVISGVLVTDTTIASTDWVKNGDGITVVATVTDGDALASVTCDLTQFGGTADQAPDGAPVGDVYTWTFTPVAGTADAAVTATVTAVDALGNTAAAGDGIMADNTAPGALAGVMAMPSHKYDAGGAAIHYNQVVVSWDDPSGLDANVAGVEFRYVATGEYPLYASAVPAAPADHTAGALAFQATGTGFEWYQLPDTSPLARDIYVLAGFVYDQAGNYGPAGVDDGHWDAATSYYLGDTHPADATGDGVVNVLDITNLGDAYGLTMPDGTHDAVNVGPTDDYTRFGLPEPDAIIGFQDLMIYAMNFGEVAPTLKAADPVGDPVLAWIRLDERTWALELVSDCPGLKALHVTGELPSGVTVTVGGGELVGEQDATVFVRNIDRNGLDAGLAVLGFGQGLQGVGQLLKVTTSQPVEDLEITIDARGLNNEELVADLQTTTDADIPEVHALDQNFPNPFNPSTTIIFALPQPEDVRLVIYGVDGRLIRTLVSDHREAGRHEVTWRGFDNAGRRVATGTYFYSIQAGDFHQVRKMSLIK